MSRLDVLFVVPMNVLDIKGGIPDAIEPPAKARFMLAYGERRGWNMAFFDANVLDWTSERIAQEVKLANPHLVVVPVYGYNPSASHQTMVSASELSQVIKNVSPGTPVMFTGVHPAALPQQTLLTNSAVDFVCGGEGPITVEDTLAVIKSKGQVSDFRKARSLWYREGDNIGHGPLAPLIDLNKEPALPGWKYMDPRQYRPHHWQRFYRVLDEDGNYLAEPYANPYSREGCPFHCSFCDIQTPYREGEQHLVNLGLLKPGVNSFRDLDPELFLEEVTYLVENYGVKFFKIPDEMFGLGTHPLKVAKLIRGRFGDSLVFWCYFRVDTCNPRILDLLRSAGFRWLALGIEAANSKVRSGQDKKFKDEDIYNIVNRLHNAGIEGALNYIFGLSKNPDDLNSFDDTMESMEATFKLACDLNGTYGNFYCAQALPGSALYRQARAKGYPLPERPGGPGWIGHAQYSYESEPCYLGESLTPAQILAFRDWAHVAYYEQPEYKKRLLCHPDLGEKAVRSIKVWMDHIRTLKRSLLGGRAFWELSKEEQTKLVPLSAWHRL